MAVNRIPGIIQGGQPRRRNPVNVPRTWKKSVIPGVIRATYKASDAIAFSDAAGTSAIHSADVIGFSDTAAPAGISTHVSASDTFTFTEAPTSTRGVSALSSLYKRYPGIDARATRRTRNPVNFPRTFGVSRVNPPEQVSYGAYDRIVFTDAATRPPISYTKSAADTLAFSDHTQTKMVSSDALSFSDAASVFRPSDAAADTFSFSDSATGVKSLSRTSSDTLSFSDNARIPTSYSGVAADAFSFADRAVGTPGTNFATCSDTLTFRDSTVYWTYDTLIFSDSAVAGPVFFAGSDSFTFSDAAVPSGFVTNARIYQVYLETTVQASTSTGFVYQAGLETAVKPNASAYGYQAALETAMKPNSKAQTFQAGNEVAVGKIYGQIWPIGWGQTRQRYGQLWPRWSRKYGGGMAED